MNILIERIAKFSEPRERRLLGYDLEECIKLKFPPGKVELMIDDVPYTILKSSVLVRDLTRWLISRSGGLSVQRSPHPKDAYSIHDIRYTTYVDYETGEVRVYDAGRWTTWTLDGRHDR
jgi:hypothetical protein